MTNVSIITNFGCSADCWYCIWKRHPLHHYFQTAQNTNWEKLEAFLKHHAHKGKVSISGGGDPLYQFTKNTDWWKNLFKLCRKNKMLIDIHTREKLHDDNFWRTINRCAFSSDLLDDDVQHLNYLTTVTQLRIVHVVTSKTQLHNIEKYIEFCSRTNSQLTLKELEMYNDHQRYQQLKNSYPNQFYLDTKDYNIYYMPNNNIHTKFCFD
jgi:organic radical activating enzyme